MEAAAESTALAHAVPRSLTYELSVNDVLEQSDKIRDIMKRGMVDGEHYGLIPGTKKPTLLKPGAEKLCLLFRFNPEYEIVEHIDDDDRVSYVMRCVLIHIPTGERIATGMGSCTTREKKYRYRLVGTDLRPSKEEAALLKAQDKGAWRKIGEEWVWHERIPNDNCRDLDNTILKMGSKRALVAAILNGTAASDIFMQDLEDTIPAGDGGEDRGEGGGGASGQRQQAQPQQRQPPPQRERPASQRPAPTAKPGNGSKPPAGNLIGRQEFEQIDTARQLLRWDTAKLSAWFSQRFGVSRAADLPMDKFNDCMNALEQESGPADSGAAG